MSKNKKNSENKKSEKSGAYYYIDADDKEIVKYSLMRDVLTGAAWILQLVMLFAFSPSGRKVIAEQYVSVAYLYIWVAILMCVVALYVNIMNFTLYKLKKRIKKERAPKKGFARRVFLGTEINIAANAAMFVFELALTCVSYDGWGVGATLMSAAATVCAVLARQASHVLLKQAVYIPSPEKERAEKIAETTSGNDVIATKGDEKTE